MVMINKEVMRGLLKLIVDLVFIAEDENIDMSDVEFELNDIFSDYEKDGNDGYANFRDMLEGGENEDTLVNIDVEEALRLLMSKEDRERVYFRRGKGDFVQAYNKDWAFVDFNIFGPKKLTFTSVEFYKQV